MSRSDRTYAAREQRSNQRHMRPWKGRGRLVFATSICVVLGGCFFPIAERQYNASTDKPTDSRFGMGCTVDGGMTIKARDGIEIVVRPPQHPGMAGETVGLVVSVPARHTAQFQAAAATFSSTQSGSSWSGMLSRTDDSPIDSEIRGHLGESSTLTPTSTMFGYSAKKSRGSGYVDSTFRFRVDSPRSFDKEFSMLLPAIRLDGVSRALPIVHFKYGVAVGICGCCGV